MIITQLPPTHLSLKPNLTKLSITNPTIKMSTNQQPEPNHRLLQVNEFEQTKLGVKGLVDSGLTRIPPIFHHPPETLFSSNPDPGPNHDPDPIPVIDLSGPDPEVVGRVKEAASKYGFFQVVNHGVPMSLLDRVVDRVRDFHELGGEEKRRYYNRNVRESGVGFFSNVDLFLSKAASWRDTLHVRLGPTPADASSVPCVCRDEILEFDKEVKQLGERLLALLSVGLGANADKLKMLSFLEGRILLGQYYPHCPEPDKTLGIASHTDPGIVTVLLQDRVGGLQVKHDGKWINVEPIHGALVINVGDMLQMVSNDEYTSVDHRVYANSRPEARVSIAVFFNPDSREGFYGPLSEVVTPEKPARYRQFSKSEFMSKFFSKELDGKSLPDNFRLHH